LEKSMDHPDTNLTRHARERTLQRDIDSRAIGFVLHYGSVVGTGETTMHRMDLRAIGAAGSAGAPTELLGTSHGVTAVVASSGRVVTVWKEPLQSPHRKALQQRRRERRIAREFCRMWVDEVELEVSA